MHNQSDERGQVRTLHLIDSGGPGGAETVFSQLAAAAAQRGENCGVVVPYDGWLAKRLRQLGIEPLIVPSKGSFAFGLAKFLWRQGRAERIQLMHVHLLGSAVYAAAVGVLLRCKVLAVFHGSTDLGESGALVGIKRWLLQRTHVSVVVVSQAVADALRDWGLDERRMTTIINGVDTMVYVPGRSDMLHQELGLPASARIVGAVGNVRAAKAYDVFVRAAARVVAARPEVHFVAAGQGTEADIARLEALCVSLGVGSNVHFLGFRADGPKLYQSLDLFVSSALSEGLPLSFLEAMACGRAIVATANEGAAKLLGDTGGGLLSPVGDAVALADNITTLLDDRDQTERLGRAGRAAVERNFSLATTIQQYRELIARIARPS